MDYSLASTWKAVVDAINERAAVLRRPLLPGTCGRLFPATLAKISNALENLARDNRWFDKAAFDEEVATCGASDGRIHPVSDFRVGEYAYPDDPTPTGSDRTFGPESMLRSLVTSPYQPRQRPTGSDDVRDFLGYACELLDSLRYVVVQGPGSGPLYWGGPAGSNVNRVGAMQYRAVNDCGTSADNIVRAGEVVPGIVTRAVSMKSGESSGFYQWAASIGAARRLPNAKATVPAFVYWFSYLEDGVSSVVPMDMELRTRPEYDEDADEIVDVPTHMACDPPGGLGYTMTYPVSMRLRYSGDWGGGPEGEFVDFTVSPQLSFEEQPAKFEFHAPCEGRLLIHVCGPGPDFHDKEGSGAYTREDIDLGEHPGSAIPPDYIDYVSNGHHYRIESKGEVHSHVFSGGGVWQRGWNTVAVVAGINEIRRPSVPYAPPPGLQWCGRDDEMTHEYRDTAYSVTVGCVVDKVIFEPAFTSLETP